METRKKRPSGAEAHGHLMDLIGPAKAVPLLQSSRKTSFSAGSEAQTHLMDLIGTTERAAEKLIERSDFGR